MQLSLADGVPIDRPVAVQPLLVGTLTSGGQVIAGETWSATTVIVLVPLTDMHSVAGSLVVRVRVTEPAYPGGGI